MSFNWSKLFADELKDGLKFLFACDDAGFFLLLEALHEISKGLIVHADLQAFIIFYIHQLALEIYVNQ